MKNTIILSLLFGYLLVVSGCNYIIKDNSTVALKVNDIQVIGSHNSYKEAIEPALLKLMQHKFDRTFEAIQYSHPSITHQLEHFGLRNLEIDILHDPKGGKYATPLGLTWLKNQDKVVKPFNTEQQLSQPGFKVLHIPDVDFRSSCLTLKVCLSEIKLWSDKHPGHLPIAITFNAKSENFDRPRFTQPEQFTSEVFDLLDQEILSVLPKDKLLTPDDVRGSSASLLSAVTTKGWPTLESSRGKFILVLDENEVKRSAYIKGHPSLRNRVMFVNAEPETDEAAFLIINEPIENLSKIQALVKQGFLVRTRADSDTREARDNDYRRFNAALASGAQFITTDYYQTDASVGTDYVIALPNKNIFRCNPVLKIKNCIDDK